MKIITREMIKEYRINKLGYDFMGYYFNRKDDLSFHHLIIAHQYCRDMGLGEGYLKWNGAILTRDTAHDYLHIIQQLDEEIFWNITSEMIDENTKGYLDIENLKRIRSMLLYFEKEHMDDRNKKGQRLIKTRYITDRIDFK